MADSPPNRYTYRLAFSYEGQRCFIAASAVVLNDAFDTAARRGFATSDAVLYKVPSSSASVLGPIEFGSRPVRTGAVGRRRQMVLRALPKACRALCLRPR